MKVKYVGPDVFHGIPARDMEEEEYNELSLNLKRIIIASKSFTFVGKAKANADTDAPEEGTKS